MANLMPQTNYSITTDQAVLNGQGTKSTHIAQVDQYQAWLAMVAHPMTPHILTGGSSDLGSSPPGGLSTTSGSFGDWHYVEILIPPGATFLAWGVVCLGYGQIRFNPYDVSGSANYLMKIKTNEYSEEDDSAHMETHWAADQIQVYSADLPRAADMSTTVGQRHPRLVTCRYQIKMSGVHFAVQALLFHCLPATAGSDFSAFGTSSGGGTDL